MGSCPVTGVMECENLHAVSQITLFPDPFPFSTHVLDRSVLIHRKLRSNIKPAIHVVLGKFLMVTL